MFEIGSGELRATFLGNHSSEATERHDNTARHYVNEQRAATRQHGGHNSTRGATPLTRRHTPYEALHTGHYTRYGAVHPLGGSAPVTGHCTRSEGVSCLRIGCSAPNHKNKRGICETTAATHKAPGARAPGALSIQRPPASIQQSAIRRQHSATTSQHSTIGDPSSPITNHQSPISSQQPLHNYQSTISRRSRWRRRGRPRR